MKHKKKLTTKIRKSKINMHVLFSHFNLRIFINQKIWLETSQLHWQTKYMGQREKDEVALIFWRPKFFSNLSWSIFHEIKSNESYSPTTFKLCFWKHAWYKDSVKSSSKNIEINDNKILAVNSSKINSSCWTMAITRCLKYRY